MPQPHRSALPGLLILIGAWQAIAGWNWATRPTPGRLAGVEWMPVEISTHHVGILLLASGLITVAGGALYRIRWLGTISTWAAICVPLLTAAPFIGAAVETGNPDRLQTVFSYATYALVILWAAYVEYRPRADADGDQ